MDEDTKAVSWEFTTAFEMGRATYNDLNEKSLAGPADLREIQKGQITVLCTLIIAEAISSIGNALSTFFDYAVALIEEERKKD